MSDSSVDQAGLDNISADDWGAAMAEQTQVEQKSSLGTQAAGVNNFASQNNFAGNSDFPTPTPQPHSFEHFSGKTGSVTHNDLDMIMDIPVQLTVELGRTKMPIKNLLQLAQGSVVELSGQAGEPLDVLINGFLIAQGEVVVVNEKLGIRLTDVITPSERLRRFSR